MTQTIPAFLYTMKIHYIYNGELLDIFNIQMNQAYNKILIKINIKLNLGYEHVFCYFTIFEVQNIFPCLKNSYMAKITVQNINFSSVQFILHIYYLQSKNNMMNFNAEFGLFNSHN